MVKKQLFYLFYIFCSFTLLVCGEKNILQNLTNIQEQESVFLAPWSRSRSKKNIWSRSRSHLGKKSGAGADKKFAGSPALDFSILFWNRFHRTKTILILSIYIYLQGWGAGKFFSGSGSWFFFKAAPAPDFFPKRLRLRLLVFFFKRLRLQGAKNTRLRPAPAPDYWLSLPKYSFPHKLVR